MEQAETEARRYTLQEYFRLESESQTKHEFRDGEILDMSGSSYAHTVITANVIGELRQLLKGKSCRVSDSNLRIRLSRSTRYVYPDASVVCGEPEFDPDDATGMSVLNPRLVVEVLSPSTASIDRGEKFKRYLELPSLQEYVLIEQHFPYAQSFFRQREGAWLMTPAEGLTASIELRSIEGVLQLSEVYANVKFPPPPADGDVPKVL